MTPVFNKNEKRKVKKLVLLFRIKLKNQKDKNEYFSCDQG
jgi:hypothetical protein